MEQLINPIKHIYLTIESFEETMEDIVDERDTEIISVLEDLKNIALMKRRIFFYK